MATRAPAAKKTARKTARKSARKAAKPAASPQPETPFASFDPTRLPQLDLAQMKLLTPEQALDFYRANARLALDVIDAAIENTAKLRRLQFDSEEEVRTRSRKAAKAAADATNPTEVMAAGQAASQEAVEHAMRYWGQMFELISEMQKRLWVILDEQMHNTPGADQAQAAMAMLPDLSQAQNVIKAMQGVVGAGGNAFEAMQKVMGDLARYMPGAPR
ncbi:MAG: phasin family protein [Burkholderiales bacterium]|nr:phasin family protein [Burkholderiales bacterium]